MEIKKWQIIFVIIFIGFIFYKSYQGSIVRKDADAEFYKNFNESFNGRVYKTYYYDLGPGRRNTYRFVYLRLLKTSVKNYDMRDSTKKGFCIIKNDSAILILSTLKSRDIKSGDYLLFDGKVDTLYHYRRGYYDYEVYNDGEIIYQPVTEATNLLPKDAKVITKWQPKDIIYGSTRESIVKKINDF